MFACVYKTLSNYFISLFHLIRILFLGGVGVEGQNELGRRRGSGTGGLWRRPLRRPSPSTVLAGVYFYTLLGLSF